MCWRVELGMSYRTAGNIGSQSNLAVWRLGKRLSNLNPSNLSAIYATYVLFYACVCTHIIYTELPPNLNLPIFLFRPLGTKPPNLKIANISGYMVCDWLVAFLRKMVTCAGKWNWV